MGKAPGKRGASTLAEGYKDEGERGRRAACRALLWRAAVAAVVAPQTLLCSAGKKVVLSGGCCAPNKLSTTLFGWAAFSKSELALSVVCACVCAAWHTNAPLSLLSRHFRVWCMCVCMRVQVNAYAHARAPGKHTSSPLSKGCGRAHTRHVFLTAGDAHTGHRRARWQNPATHFMTFVCIACGARARVHAPQGHLQATARGDRSARAARRGMPNDWFCGCV